MLVGNNKLVLNHSTMALAVEEYVNKRLVGTRIKVTSITHANSEFSCNVQPAEEPTDGQQS